MFLASFQQFETQMDNDFRGLDDVISMMSKANIPTMMTASRISDFPRRAQLFWISDDRLGISHQPIV